jgi:hypothetical protein
MLAVDQHDKWKHFGLVLHTGIDPFFGRTHWIKVYWTNNNPKVIVSYYFTFIKEGGCMCWSCVLFSYLSIDFIVDIPLITQSNPGSKNYGIANAHTMLCHLHDFGLVGTV